uniref:Uncharacterized protein n=1 Tax=Arundo donax TaxID=35708 RepID=A0A0A9AS32_ARUDO
MLKIQVLKYKFVCIEYSAVL